MIKEIYNKLFTQSTKNFISRAFLHDFRRFQADFKCKVIYSLRSLLPDTPSNRLYFFMAKHGVTAYPYEFMLEYQNLPVDYFMDEDKHLPFVLHNGNKLYFPRCYSREFTLEIYRTLLTEQDPRSPHRYVKSYDELSGKVLLDVGAAEGIFTLDVINFVKHSYLFECDENWIEALEATFAPWKNKITIVRKYISDKNDANYITIDEFLKDKPHNNIFLKMDIEGFEQQALKGAITLLTNKETDFSICTYHKSKDVSSIYQLLKAAGFETEFTPGYLFYSNELRTAIIRKKKLTLP